MNLQMLLVEVLKKHLKMRDQFCYVRIVGKVLQACSHGFGPNYAHIGGG
jgi:hypothetical protein